MDDLGVPPFQETSIIIYIYTGTYLILLASIRWLNACKGKHFGQTNWDQRLCDFDPYPNKPKMVKGTERLTMA